MTRKMAAVALASGMIAAGACFGGTITIQNLVPYIYMHNGDLVPVSSNWVIAVYNAGPNGVANNFGTGDDTLITTLGGWSDPGYFVTTYTSTGGVSVFTRVYNSPNFVNDANPGTATEYVNLSFSPYTTADVQTVPDITDGGDTWSYNTGGSNPTGGDWLPVPEPGTLALMGVGFMAVAVRRRLKKRA